MKKLLITILCFCCLQSPVVAKGVYQTTEQFVAQAFNDTIPKVKAIWLTAEDKSAIAEIMSHSYKRIRIRYWQKDNETVWVLNEIGKEKPITIGVHIKAEQIAQLKVLAFRESRGDEVRHDFFTDQFEKTTLTKENELNQSIDGITGATMSVRALTKVARLALWLNLKVANDSQLAE